MAKRIAGESGTETDLVARVRNEDLPESVVPLLAEYEEVIGDRNPYLWRWLAHLFPKFTLSCVDDRHRDRVQEAKLLASLFVTVVDDLAEKEGDRATFEEAAKLPFDHQRTDPHRDGVDTEPVRFLADVWAQFDASIADSPRLEEFETLLQFDLRQVLQAIEYTSVADEYPELVCEGDLWRYDVYNMMVLFYADLDLVNAPAFDTTELASLRRIVRRTQRMGRICNWIVTWERELAEGDCVSGVVVRALEEGVVSNDQLRAIRESPTPETVAPVVEAIENSDLERQFLDRWQAEYEEAMALASTVDSVDVAAYLEGFETILDYHLESRGLL